MAERKQLMTQEHLSRATELSLEPGGSRQAPSHWLDSRSATWSYWAGGATQAYLWIAQLLRCHSDKQMRLQNVLPRNC